jgi:hypothetical protein
VRGQRSGRACTTATLRRRELVELKVGIVDVRTFFPP